MDEAHLALDVSGYLERLPRAGFSLHIIPRLSNEYEGSTLSMIIALAFSLFGESVFVLRAIHVLFGLGALICIHYVVSRWFNRRTAFFTILLLSINSTFIRAARIGNFRDEIFQIFLFWLGLAFIQRCFENKHRINLYAAGLIFGLAFNAKVMFLGYAVSGLIALFLFWPSAKKFLLDRIFRGWGRVIGFGFSFLLGALHFILFHLLSGFTSFEWVWKNFSGSNHGWNNLHLFRNLETRLTDFRFLLESQTVADSITTPPNLVMPVMFALVLVTVLVLGLPRKSSFSGIHRIYFFLVMYSILLVLTCFIPALHSSGHMIVMIPIVELTVAFFINVIFEYLKRGTPQILLGILLSLLLVLPHVSIETQILKQFILRVKCGESSGEFSSLLYNVADYLEKNNYRKVYSFTDFISMNVVFVTGGKIACPGDWPRPRYELMENASLPGPAEDERDTGWQENLDARTIFTLRTLVQNDLPPSKTTCIIGEKGSDNWENIFELISYHAESRGNSLALEKTFTGIGRNRAEYELYRIGKSRSATTPPLDADPATSAGQVFSSP